jgi:hypothetical protein
MGQVQSSIALTIIVTAASHHCHTLDPSFLCGWSGTILHHSSKDEK